MKKKFLVFFLLVSFANIVFAQRTKYNANRVAALNCLAQAKNYAKQDNWQAVFSETQLGLAYDDEISDLWFMKSLANEKVGGFRFESLEDVERAIDLASWFDYHRDEARILYADLLSETCHLQEAQNVLDAKPQIKSADADFIRAKVFYRQGTASSRSRARAILEKARKLYPKDVRFASLFFAFENPSSLDGSAKRLSANYLRLVQDIQVQGTSDFFELEFFSIDFADSREREYMLRSLKSRNAEHPLYARLALEAGLLSQEEAFDYFTAFADSQIGYKFLADLIPYFTEENVLSKVKDYFSSYNGELCLDLNNDHIVDFFVQYKDGRPSYIRYEAFQDGRDFWNCTCDFGTPISANFKQQKIDVEWAEFPELKNVVFKDRFEDFEEKLLLIPHEKVWSPIRIEKEPVLFNTIGLEFLFPVINESEIPLTRENLLSSTSSVIVPSTERENASIEIHFIDGEMYSADYKTGTVLFAKAEFENGLPSLRLVDANGDGIFETTEFYSKYEDATNVEVNSEEEKTLMARLFGTESESAPFYLRMIQVDNTGDSVPDYAEEYFADGGKIASWDTDGDGKWNIRAVTYSRKKDSEGNFLPRIQESIFYDSFADRHITIQFEDSKPKSVTLNDKVSKVIQDKNFTSLYWLNTEGSTSLAKDIIKTLTDENKNAVSMIVQNEKERALSIKIDDFFYALLIRDYDYGTADEK